MQDFTAGNIDQQTKSAYQIQQFVTQQALLQQNNGSNDYESRNLNSVTTNLDMINQDLHQTIYNNKQYYQEQNLNQNSIETAPYMMKNKKILKPLIKRHRKLYKKTIRHKKSLIKKPIDRIETSILPYLHNLSSNLQFKEQIDQLKKHSLKSTFLPFQKMIGLPYKLKGQNSHYQRKPKKHNYFVKKTNILLNEKQDQIIRSQLGKSLEKIAMQIQKPYQFFINQQKNSFNQKQQKVKFLEDEFYDKKDCQQIKTIVDYTQGQQYDHQKRILDYQFIGFKKKSFLIDQINSNNQICDDLQNYSHQNNQMETN